MGEVLRVGVIGANAAGSWGTFAHLPALAALPGFTVSAVCAAHLDSAQATAGKFAIPHAFDDPRAMAQHADVDVVAVCVRVPHHRELVLAALDAGKHVYCEWPLARTTAEAEELLAAARASGRVHMVGLQARQAPALLYVRDLIAQGSIGQVHAASLSHSVPWTFGGRASAAYLEDRASGAHFLSIPGGHSIDAFCWLLGEFQQLSATVGRVDLGVEVASPPPTSANQVTVSGRLASGAAASIRLSGAPGHGSGVRLEINGAHGDLIVSSPPGGRGVQMADLRIQRTVALGQYEDMEIPEAYFGVPPAVRANPPLNVARGYLEFAQAIAGGREATPDFAAAVARHRTLDAVELSSATGARLEL